MNRQTAAEYIKERIGENLMTKMERLELENAVLRNVIACVSENIEIAERIGEEPYLTLAGIISRLKFQEKIDFAVRHKKIIDCRLSAKTLEDCEWRFERFEDRVILNDGMVMGFEY